MKRKSSQKLTTNQMEFKKELKRIKRFIHNARKRGYEFDDNVLPKQPKRITRKKVEEIKNIKPSNLYDKAVYYDEVTHETFTGQQGRRLERHRASLKAKKTREENNQIRIRTKNEKEKKYKDKIGKKSIEEKEKKSTDKTDKKSTGKKEKKSTDKTNKKSTGTKEKKSTETKSKKNKQKTKNTDTNKGTEYYPTVDVIDEIGERLVNVDYVMKKLTENTPEEDYRYIWKRKSTANDYEPSWFYANIWAETIRKYEEQNALSELEEYVKQHALEITNSIDIVYWASKQEELGNWQRLSSRLVLLLKGGEIPTLGEAQQLGELQEQNDLVSDSYED